MLNSLQTKRALTDRVREKILNKIATRIVYNGEKDTYVKLEVADTLDVKDIYFGR